MLCSRTLLFFFAQITEIRNKACSDLEMKVDVFGVLLVGFSTDITAESTHSSVNITAR